MLSCIGELDGLAPGKVEQLSLELERLALQSRHLGATNRGGAGKAMHERGAKAARS